MTNPSPNGSGSGAESDGAASRDVCAAGGSPSSLSARAVADRRAASRRVERAREGCARVASGRAAVMTRALEHADIVTETL